MRLRPSAPLPLPRRLPALALACLSVCVGSAAAGTLAAAAPADDEVVDAGPQPGDGDDGVPVVDPRAPVVVDAGPVPVKGKPRPAAAPAPVVDAAADAAAVDATPPSPDAEAAKAQPAPAAAPVVDDTKPAVDDTAPRIDPAGERIEPAGAAEAPAPDKIPDGIGFGGVPAINYDSDNGFGFGIVGTMFFYDGKTRPYRAALTLQLFMTSKLVHDHNIVLDWLDVGDQPLRLWLKAGYLQSLTQNYCGLGGAVTCDKEVAERAAADLGLGGSIKDAFAASFYQRRFIDPYGVVQARWALLKQPGTRFELTAGYKGYYFQPGTWDDNDQDGDADLFPYPGSLFARDFPGGEPGFDSSVQLGFMFDTRDNEPAPTDGMWVEGSVRGASILTASTWQWLGANLTMRGYSPLTADHKVVLATRFVVDGVIGDPPIQSLVRVGGSNDHYIYGGSEAGRGIRAQRYIGKLRVYDQTELRWRFWDVQFLGQDFGFTGAGFVDVGIVGKEIADPGPMDLLPGFGGALRVSWNENFVIRVDVGASPIEGFAPQTYILIGHPF